MKVSVSVKVAGGKTKLVKAETVAQLKADLGIDNYTAAINGESASDMDALNEGDFVTFAPAVKGGI